MRDWTDEDLLKHEVRINGFDPDDMSRPPLTHATIYDLSFIVIFLAMAGWILTHILVALVVLFG